MGSKKNSKPKLGDVPLARYFCNCKVQEQIKQRTPTASKATITFFSLFWIYTQYVVVKEYISERIINITFIYKAVILLGRFRVVLTSYSVKRLFLVRAGSWNRSEVVGN